MALIVSVSGVRGIVGEELTPEVALRYAAAFGGYVGSGRVAVGGDGRPSGVALRHAVIAGLAGTGCDVVDLGILPTPTCGLLVRELNCNGGVQITASHNPSPYNGLKLFGSDGAVLGLAAGQKVERRYRTGDVQCAPWNGCGKLTDASAEADRHRRRVCELTDTATIEKAGYRVVLDANGGAGGPLALALLRTFGCEVTPVACEPDGVFRHEAEPTPANLRDIEQLVRERPGSIGAALDPDADRLALIDETGVCLSEELTLALAVRSRLVQERGPVVINLSTSRVTEDVASQFGVPCFRSAVGEANVVTMMRETSAIVGGEGNGGVIDPRVGWVRDPFIGLGLILGLMAQSGKRLAELAGELPKYVIHKAKFEVTRDRLSATLDALVKRWSSAKVDRTDGLRLDWADRWLHVRGSNTEPVVRVIVEAADGPTAASLCHETGAVLSSV